MRSFITLLETDVDFVDGDSVSDDVAKNYEEHLMAEIQAAVERLSLRTIRGHKIGKLQLAEIKGSVSL
jgi:hypothetical protein